MKIVKPLFWLVAVMLLPAMPLLALLPQPTLITPVNNHRDTLHLINFSWDTVSQAQYYLLEVDSSGTFAFPLLSHDETLTTFSTTFNYGQYYWRLKAFAPGNTDSSIWSEVRIFTIIPGWPEPPILMSPDSNASINNVQPIFQWMQDAYATRYELQLLDKDYHTLFVDIVLGTSLTIPFQLNLDSQPFHWRVRSGDDFGTWSDWSPQWTFWVDTIPPLIDHSVSDTMTIFANGDAQLPFVISDNVGVDTAMFCLGPAGGSLTLYDQPLILQAGDNYVLPLSNIPWRGLMYEVKAYDKSGNLTRYPQESDAFYVKEVTFPQGQNLISSILPYDRWRMVSAPGDYQQISMHDQVADDLGTYDNTKWRLFRWQNDGYMELSTGGSGHMIPGDAFWLRHRVDQVDLRIDFESIRHSLGNRLSTQPFHRALQPGWNDVANPWQFNVDFNEVLASSQMIGVQGPYAYDGNKWLLPDSVLGGVNGAAMKPFDGYSFLVTDGSVHELSIPCHEQFTKSGRGYNWPEGWRGQLIISDGVNNIGYCYFGIGEGTSQERDDWDLAAPPSGLVPAAGYFRIGDERYATDLRPELGQGQAWEYELASAGQVSLEFGLSPGIPPEAGIWLLDPVRQSSFPITEGFVYQYAPEPGETSRRLKLVVGGEEYIRAALAGAFGVPSATLMEHGRPNPFNQTTTINYQLAAGGPVRLAVYNVAGQLVRTLVDRTQLPGRYGVRWDGRDGQGRRLANGVYLVRMTAGGVSSSQRLTLVR